MSSNPYPDTRHLFSEEYCRRHAEPPLQPDYSDYPAAGAAKIDRDFRRLATAMRMSPGRLLVYGMVTAIELGYGAGVIEEAGK